MSRTIRAFVHVMALVLGAVVAQPLRAASPPSTIHYQGVLRDAADNPRNGAFDMVFRFYDAPTGGNEILVDRHEAAGAGAVTVSGGLFGADLGGGTVQDGASPGTYAALSQVFRDFADVYLEITIGAEVL